MTVNEQTYQQIERALRKVASKYPTDVECPPLTDLHLLCIVTGFWHQQTVGWGESHLMLWIAGLFGAVHIMFFLVRGIRR